jgi:hypothetical protein
MVRRTLASPPTREGEAVRRVAQFGPDPFYRFSGAPHQVFPLHLARERESGSVTRIVRLSAGERQFATVTHEAFAHAGFRGHRASRNSVISFGVLCSNPPSD